MANLGFSTSNPFLGQDNPYLRQNIDATLGDVTRNYNTAVKPQMENSMVNSGSFGNSGLMEMQGNQQRQLGETLGRTAGAMRLQDYGQQQDMYKWDQGFDRDLYNDAYGQQQQNLQTGIGLLDRMQAYDVNDTNNATTIQNTPMNYWQQFSGGANSIGQGYGNTTGSQTGGGSNPWVSALGGAQLGSSMQKSMGWGGWGGGSTAGSSLSKEVSGLGSNTWNPYGDYNTGANGWGSYGE